MFRSFLFLTLSVSFLATGARADVSLAPRLAQVERVEAEAGSYGQPKLIRQDGRLFSNNLTRRKSTTIEVGGRWPGFLGRAEFQGRSLIAVSGYLASGSNGSFPHVVQIIDEDTGLSIQRTVLDYGASGWFGKDRQGRLKILLAGYEIFGLLDVESGSFRHLLPVRRQPSDFPAEVALSIGHFIHVTLDGKIALMRLQDLINGRVKPVRTFPAETHFLGGVPAKFSVTYERDAIVIEDLATGKVLGSKIARKGSIQGRAAPRVTDLLVSGEHAMVTLTEPVHPNSYVTGTRHLYIDVMTGAVLRTSERDRGALQSSLALSPSGAVTAIERAEEDLDHKNVEVIDLSTDKVLSSVGRIAGLGSPFQSTSGRLVALRIAHQDTLCVFDLLEPKQETCLKDPLIHGAIRYGYGPFVTTPGRLILPLLGRTQENFFPSYGFVEFSVD